MKVKELIAHLQNVPGDMIVTTASELDPTHENIYYGSLRSPQRSVVLNIPYLEETEVTKFEITDERRKGLMLLGLRSYLRDCQNAYEERVWENQDLTIREAQLRISNFHAMARDKYNSLYYDLDSELDLTGEESDWAVISAFAKSVIADLLPEEKL